MLKRKESIIHSNVSFDINRVFKYGINPDEDAFLLNQSDPFYSVLDSKSENVSVNNILDVDFGVKLLKGTSIKSFIFVKHVNLVSMYSLNNLEYSMPVEVISMMFRSTNTTHGTLISNVIIDIGLAREICKYYIHVLAAYQYTEEALVYLQSENIQLKMGGLRIIKLKNCYYKKKQIVTTTQLVDGNYIINLHKNDYTNCVYSTSTENEAVYTYVNALKHLKTISVVTVYKKNIIFTISGFTDVREALEYTILKLNNFPRNIDLKQVTLFCDGCFSKFNPIKLLQESGIRNLYVSGMKSSEKSIVDEAAQCGISIRFLYKRLFSN